MPEVDAVDPYNPTDPERFELLKMYSRIARDYQDLVNRFVAARRVRDAVVAAGEAQRRADDALHHFQRIDFKTLSIKDAQTAERAVQQAEHAADMATKLAARASDAAQDASKCLT